jgi:hypothetical protein
VPRCKICRDKFTAKYFLQKACLNPACLAEWSNLDREGKADKKHKARKKEYYDNHKPTRTEAAQKYFNTYIRLRDSNCNCISCGRSTGCKINAGHYKSVGSTPELRFNELNVHLQCEHCNMFKSGNIENYRINLINKIGLDKVEWLEGAHEPKKYTCAELKEIELMYKEKTKKYLN